jgi:hypothetical protein
MCPKSEFRQKTEPPIIHALTGKESQTTQTLFPKPSSLQAKHAFE